MITGALFNKKEDYKLGEETEIFLQIDDASQDYVMTVYASHANKYLDTEFKYVDTATNISLDKVTKPAPIGNALEIKINTYFLTQPDVLFVHVENASDSTDYYDFFFQVGKFYAFVPDMIHVYGYLYDSRGNPIKLEPITFTVLNSATAFDNSPMTTMTATTLTDEQGRFDINLNRSYDYVLVVAKYQYSKVIRISRVPHDVTSVEVMIGRGLVCDS